jgi:hypothetical protein
LLKINNPFTFGKVCFIAALRVTTKHCKKTTAFPFREATTSNDLNPGTKTAKEKLSRAILHLPWLNRFALLFQILLPSLEEEPLGQVFSRL